MLSNGGDILNTPLTRVQNIVYDSNKSEFLGINLRQGKYVGPDAPKNHIKFLISEGYASPKEYEVAKYPLLDRSFDRYSAIDWNPNISVSGNAATIIAFPSLGQKEIIVFLEGMGTDGTLISTMKTIRLN